VSDALAAPLPRDFFPRPHGCSCAP
jgi:hypothetical protein